VRLRMEMRPYILLLSLVIGCTVLAADDPDPEIKGMKPTEEPSQEFIEASPIWLPYVLSGAAFQLIVIVVVVVVDCYKRKRNPSSDDGTDFPMETVTSNEFEVIDEELLSSINKRENTLCSPYTGRKKKPLSQIVEEVDEHDEVIKSIDTEV
ncbi:unnamed protein product, partial [Meganyctiphanes norvegica]